MGFCLVLRVLPKAPQLRTITETTANICSYGPDTALRALHLFTHSTLIVPPTPRYYYHHLHLMNEETRELRGTVNWPRLQGWQVPHVVGGRISPEVQTQTQ